MTHLIKSSYKLQCEEKASAVRKRGKICIEIAGDKGKLYRLL